MPVKHAEKPGPISKVPGESVIRQNVPEVPATSPARGLKHIRLLTICLIALATFLLFHAGPSAARERLPGEPCQIEPPRNPKTKKFLWSKPERWVWKQVCEGEIADFNARYGVWLDPKSADGWKEDRELSGTFLETILLHEPFRSALTRNGVRIVGAWFPNPVDLAHGRLNHQLWLDRSRFESPISLGSLRSLYRISVDGSEFTHELNMDSMEVGGDLFMSDDAEFADVSLRGAKIGGQLSMIGSKFTGELDMASMEVSGNLFMRGGAEFADVRLRGAKISGQLSMIGSKFTGKLDTNSMEVGGSLLMRDGEFTRPVNLTFSRIDSNLDLSDTELRDLDLTGTQIKGELRLGSGRHPATKWSDDARLTLRNTEVSALQDRKDAWPENLDLDGFTYQRLGGFGAGGASDMAERPTRWFIDWLAKDKSYSPQPYKQLATVLRNAGHAGKANDVLYAGKERERRIAWCAEKPVDPCEKKLGAALMLESLKWTIGYGFRYHYALVWVIGLVLLGGVVWQEAREPAERRMPYGLMYSLDRLLPVIQLRRLHYEEIDLVTWARYYFYVHQIMGYVLVFFLVAGLSGLTK